MSSVLDPSVISPSAAVEAFGERLRSRIHTAGNITVSHPAEVRLLRTMSPGEFEDFKQRHELISSSRMGGRMIEFSHRGANLPTAG